MPKPSTLSPRKYRIMHEWNEHFYFVEHLSCDDSDNPLWFVTSNGTFMVCNKKRHDFGGLRFCSPFAEAGFKTAQQAIKAFDKTMTVRYGK